MFQKATKTAAKLRLAIAGPSGSGKTYTSLLLAAELARHAGGRVAVIDSERGSAAKYADRFDFDAMTPKTHHPDNYIAAIHEAERAGYAVVVVDSFSHAWAGAGGVLEVVDKAMDKSKGNKFVAWSAGTPLHNSLLEAVLGSRCHVIATMRTKTEWVLETNEKGKQTPRKIGTAPVQREGVEYEFDVVGELNLDHELSISKTRAPDLDGRTFRRPGAEFAAELIAWLGGPPAPERPAEAPPSPPVSPPAPNPSAAGEREARAAHADRVAAVRQRLDRGRAVLGEAEAARITGPIEGLRLVEVEAAADRLEAAIRAAAERAASKPPSSSSPPSSSGTVDEQVAHTAAVRAAWTAAQRAGWRHEEVTRLAGERFGGRPVRELALAELAELTELVASRSPPPRGSDGARSVTEEARRSAAAR